MRVSVGEAGLDEVMRVEPPPWDQCLGKERSREKRFVCKPEGVFCTCWCLDLPTSQPPKMVRKK